MNPRRLALLVTVLAVAVLAPHSVAVAASGSTSGSASSSGEEAAAAKRRSCGLIASTSVYRYARVIAIRGVRCRVARRVAKGYDNRSRQLGSWRCGLAHDDLPRLFSCGAGRAGAGDLRTRRRALEAVGTNRRAARAEAGASRCGSVSYGGRAYILFYERLGCTSARRKVRHVHRFKKLRGWKCTSGSGFKTGGFCKRGARQFGWHPGD